MENKDNDKNLNLKENTFGNQQLNTKSNPEQTVFCKDEDGTPESFVDREKLEEHFSSGIKNKHSYNFNGITKRIPTAISGGALYILLTFLFLTLGAYTQLKNVYFGIAFTEIVILGVTVFVICKLFKYDLGLTLGLEKPKRGTMFRAFLIVISSYFILTIINGFSLQLITKYIPLPAGYSSAPMPKNFPMLLISLVLFAILPGIFEELIFRGFLFRALGALSVKSKIFFTALLFGLFHYNPFNFVGPFLLGLIFGYIRWRSSSIYPTMIAHATNNAISLFLGYITLSSGVDELEKSEEIMNNISSIQIVFSIVIIILLTTWFYKLIKNYPDYSEKIKNIIPLKFPEKVLLFISLVVAVSVMTTMIISLKYGPIFKL